jgi:sulfite exporter TauE/SafE
VSGAVFVVTGVLLIILGVRAIAQAQHEIMTMVKPTSTFRLDTPAGPAR